MEHKFKRRRLSYKQVSSAVEEYNKNSNFTKPYEKGKIKLYNNGNYYELHHYTGTSGCIVIPYANGSLREVYNALKLIPYRAFA